MFPLAHGNPLPIKFFFPGPALKTPTILTCPLPNMHVKLWTTVSSWAPLALQILKLKWTQLSILVFFLSLNVLLLTVTLDTLNYIHSHLILDIPTISLSFSPRTCFSSSVCILSPQIALSGTRRSSQKAGIIKVCQSTFTIQYHGVYLLKLS